MTNNFFEGLDGLMDGLGEKITKKAKELGGQAETIYEAQKLRNKISNAKRLIDKELIELGKLVFKKYMKGEEVKENLDVFCERIKAYQRQIHTWEDELADIQGLKVCPSCQQRVSRDAAFCPNCGTACTVVDEGTDEEDIIDAEAEEVCPKCEEDAETDEDASTESEEVEMEDNE